MKKILLLIALSTTLLTKAQSVFVSDMQNLGLGSGQVYNGSSGGSGFQSGHAFFPTVWDTSFGGYWSAGWVASAVHDSSTSGSANQYGCAAYNGYGNSSAFAMGTTFGTLTIRMTDSLVGRTVKGFYVSNSTYAYKSMLNGDMFAKKFGDTTGTHCGCPQGSYPDWFKLTVKRYYQGYLRNDSAEVYLADYRYSNNTQDYILKTWAWIDLDSLGNTDSLTFFLSSSDNGMYGMNTPAYFCIDNLTLSTYMGIESYLSENDVAVYPNPSHDFTEIIYKTESPAFTEMRLTDISGREITSQRFHSMAGTNKFKIDLSDVPRGFYYITLQAGDNLITKKLIKE
jgi:hypothetical protein